MQLSLSDLMAIITILAGLLGFTFAGPGDVKNIAQAVFYIGTIVFFILIFRRVWPRKPKEYQP
jgi:uncharacterized membrane protein YtjA (UPF0391 family)